MNENEILHLLNTIPVANVPRRDAEYMTADYFGKRMVTYANVLHEHIEATEFALNTKFTSEDKRALLISALIQGDRKPIMGLPIEDHPVYSRLIDMSMELDPTRLPLDLFNIKLKTKYRRLEDIPDHDVAFLFLVMQDKLKGMNEADMADDK